MRYCTYTCQFFRTGIPTTRGKMITPKHFLKELGLHNMTGQNHIVYIINKLDHRVSYYRTCEIETAQVETANKYHQSGILLPLLPETPDDIALTYFWVDNLDKKIDSEEGGGRIHMTTLVAFQEKSVKVVKTVRKFTNIPKSRYLSFINHTLLALDINIDTKKEPPRFGSLADMSYDAAKFSKHYFMRLLLRKQNAFDQIVPNYYGWALKNMTCVKEKLEKTVEVYLIPEDYSI